MEVHVQIYPREKHACFIQSWENHFSKRNRGTGFVQNLYSTNSKVSHSVWNFPTGDTLLKQYINRQNLCQFYTSGNRRPNTVEVIGNFRATSEVGSSNPKPYVGKLVVAYRWSAVYSTEPWPTVCPGFLSPQIYPSWYDLHSVESVIKPPNKEAIENFWPHKDIGREFPYWLALYTVANDTFITPIYHLFFSQHVSWDCNSYFALKSFINLKLLTY